jgi:hypothetical protein
MTTRSMGIVCSVSHAYARTVATNTEVENAILFKR